MNAVIQPPQPRPPHLGSKMLLDFQINSKVTIVQDCRFTVIDIGCGLHKCCMVVHFCEYLMGTIFPCGADSSSTFAREVVSRWSRVQINTKSVFSKKKSRNVLNHTGAVHFDQRLYFCVARSYETVAYPAHWNNYLHSRFPATVERLTNLGKMSPE